MDEQKKVSKLIPKVKSRELTPEEVRRLELGIRIWKQWKINFGISNVLIRGGK